MAMEIKGQIPEKVVMLELLLRDGMQHAEKVIQTEAKVWYAEQFIRAGYTKIEVTNFGHPKILVQSRDAEDILEQIHKLKIYQEKKFALSKQHTLAPEKPCISSRLTISEFS